jgi:lysophospholipase L1-like esterase
VVWNTEGHGVTHYVADGEVATPYQDGVSVAVLGDSHTEGWELDDDEKFVSIAEQSLREDCYEADLHNLGHSADTLADYVYLAPYVRQRYAPQLMVIQLVTDSFGANAFNPAFPNYFVSGPDGQLAVKHHVQADRTLRWLKRSIAILDYGYARFQELTSGMQHGASPADSPDQRAEPSSDRVGKELQALRAAYPNTPMVLVFLPWAPNVGSSGLTMDDPQYHNLVAQAEEVPGWTIVDPLGAFDQLVAEGHLPRGFDNSVIGEGHMNAAGNRIVGLMLAQAIEKEWR